MQAQNKQHFVLQIFLSFVIKKNNGGSFSVFVCASVVPVVDCSLILQQLAFQPYCSMNIFIWLECYLCYSSLELNQLFIFQIFDVFWF